jgi:trehalose 6-phosphate synthase/phosphatase
MQRALEMKKHEQAERMAPLQRRVVTNDVHRWVRGFLASLNEDVEPGMTAPPMLEPDVLAESLGPTFASAPRALLVLDYDGTLREFTPRHEDAVPTAQIVRLLKDLGALDGVEVFISSGRDRGTLDTWFGRLPVSLISEHGAFVRYRGSTEWSSFITARDLAWKKDVLAVMKAYAARTPGTRVEEKSHALVWHYREADHALGEWQARELASLLEQRMAQSPVEVVSGARVVEVRLQGMDKGRAYETVSKAGGGAEFVLVAGDDRTDEDLFGAVEDTAVSIKVGPGPSKARTAVSLPAAMRTLLASLVKARVKGPQPG